MDTKDVVDTLNHLVENAKDGEYGFDSCAEHARTPELKQSLTQYAQQCRLQAQELQARVAALGGEPEDGGTAGGKLHRGWVAVKGTLAGYSDVAMLEECERGEDASLARYRKTLNLDLPVDVRVLLERQCEVVQRTHDEVRALRDRARSVAA